LGPLQGVRIIEIAAIGPAPFCGMMLADMGADMLRIEQPGGRGAGVDFDRRFSLLNRGRPSLTVDLKTAAGRGLVLDLAGAADMLFEGFRPGVMERLGLGPDELLAANPRLVYGRVTGWGQSGPLAQAAGHDLNYIALAGALHAIGPKDQPPAPPLNLIGDFGGGGMLLALGVLAALIEAQRSGRGQIVDAAMVDGTATLMTLFFGLRAAGLWAGGRGENVLDGGAPWYGVYRTSDGKFVAVASIEPKFYRLLIERLGLDESALPPQYDRDRWPELREIFARTFAAKSQAEWCALLEGSDACFAPVLAMEEMAEHPHVTERDTLLSVGGIVQPAPSPRFSRTPGSVRSPAGAEEPRLAEILQEWGLSPERAAEALAYRP
jgi:alpha-methylacyl-CoA racemase